MIVKKVTYRGGTDNHMTTNRKKIRLSLLAALRNTMHSGSKRSRAAIITKGLCLGLLAVSFFPHQVAAEDNAAQLPNPSLSSSAQKDAATLSTIETQPAAVPQFKRANFEQEQKTRDAQYVADWAVDSGDNQGMPFVIVDKIDAKVFAFDANGQLRGAAPCLLGLARGDDSIPGIGNKKLSAIRPDDRTTPAGRFVASLGYNFNKKDVLWVDYGLSLSMHRIITTKERLQRMATPTPLDNRISFGCINVPAEFFNNVLSPTFTGTRGIVYILPETRPINVTFAKYYDVE
jgi:hypothetical protein